MVGMMGSRSADNTLTGLVNIVSDPAKYKQSMDDLKAATEQHRAARDAAAKQKTEAEKTIAKVNERLAFLQDVDAKAAAAQAKLNTTAMDLETKRAAHEAAVANFNEAFKAQQKVHADKVAAQEKELAAQKAEFEAKQKTHLEAVDKLSVSNRARKASLESTASRLSARSAQLDAREADIVKLELDVRTRVSKINELFPVS